MEFEQKTLADLNLVRHLANSLGSGAKKSLGQNFLVNQKSLLRFINLLHITPDDIVVEIGPGIGVISYTLCTLAKKVYLIEIDRDKESALAKTLTNYSNYEILWDDAKNISWKNLGDKFPVDTQIKIISSLPYNAAKKIIYNLVTSDINWSEAAFFLQKEVAENYTSRPPKADFLSTFISLYADVQYSFQVPPEHFYPQPKVYTGVIHLTRKLAHRRHSEISKFIYQGFTQPRKTVLNNLKSLKVDKETLRELSLSETIRPSEMTLENWIALFEKVNSI